VTVNRKTSTRRILFIIVVLLLLSGCWDRKEIEERATILGLAVDLAEDEEEPTATTHPENVDVPSSNLGLIKITAQLAVPGQVPLGPSQGGDGSSSQNAVWVVEGIGHTMEDAVQNIQQQLAHKIFFGQLQVIILSEDVAKKGISHINEYLRRRPEIRRTAWMAINGKNAAETMEVAPRLERIPSIYLSTMFEEATKMGKFPEADLGRFWVQTSNIGQDGFLPYISVKSKENIEISGMAYFNEDKMVGKTKPYQIAFYNSVAGINPGGAAALIKLSDDESVMFESTRRKTSYDVRMKENLPYFFITIDIWGLIKEKSTDKLKLDDKKTIEKIEKLAEEHGKREMLKLISETQDNESDIFGFGEYVRGDLSSFWDEEVKNSTGWKKVYQDLPIDIKVRIHIDRVGMKAK